MGNSREKILMCPPDYFTVDFVDTADAGNFACNAVNVGDMVFLNKASDPLRARLMLAGFKVCEVGLSEFLKAGGSAQCLTLKLTEPLLA